MTHRCLNSYYQALQNETVTSHSLRLQTAQLPCSLIPAALQNEPVFLSVDDTTVPKFGKKFDAVSLLHDHACHTGKPYVNGHCFVSLTLSVPVLNRHEGKAPLIRYLAVPVGYRMWTKEQTKLELAGDLIEEVMPLLKDRQVLLLFDSWYAKSSLIERVLQYPGLDIICNVRSDSAMYELPPLPNGKSGRQKKTRKADSYE
ncbi:MAG: transposase [Limosilactobacillus oris]|uniref:IS701 family transposase n=1 Tax=Megasphaera sp. TaxID=2023260 RepID=UPI0025C1E4A4|nr:transposase [Megasphaera sp.]MCH3903708.1 transposase [Limosilactobacillus oris]MCH3931229.1 transposase [Megasphaera sp.]